MVIFGISIQGRVTFVSFWHNLVVVVLEPRQEPKPALNPSMEDKLAQASPVLKRANRVMLQPVGLTGVSGV